MESETRVSIQPGTDIGVHVAGSIVQNDVKILRLGKLTIEAPEEAQELLVAVAGSALTDHHAVDDVEGGVEVGGAMALVVVGS